VLLLLLAGQLVAEASVAGPAPAVPASIAAAADTAVSLSCPTAGLSGAAVAAELSSSWGVVAAAIACLAAARNCKYPGFLAMLLQLLLPLLHWWTLGPATTAVEAPGWLSALAPAAASRLLLRLL
jgi:hypothetical protein